MQRLVTAAFVALLTLGTGLSTAAAEDLIPQLVEHDVEPADTNNAITHHDAANVAAFAGNKDGNDRLLVFFESASSLRLAPSCPLLMEALAQHYRVLMVDYVYHPAGIT